MAKIKQELIGKVKAFTAWVKNNPWEFLLLLSIVGLGAVLRLYKIGEYMTFLGDEGRDAIIVRRLLIDFDPILVGPRTSIGDMYLGPLYYYMMAPALLLANFSPVGPSVMVALLNLLTIIFIWRVAKEWFGKLAANISALLFAVSPVVIIYSRSSWNPNIMPFFALLSVYAIWKVWKASGISSQAGDFLRMGSKWLVVCAISVAFVLQSHYLGLLLIPVIFTIWILSILRLGKRKGNLSDFKKFSLISIIILALLMSPLLIFDARHGFRNFSSMKLFFTERQTTVSLKAWKGIPNLWPIFRDGLVTRIVSAYDSRIGKYLTVTLVAFGGYFLIRNMKKILYVILGRDDNKDDKYFSLFLLIIWLFFGLLGLSVYKQHIYDHYFGFLYPAVFLFIGGLAHFTSEYFGDSGKIFSITFTLVLFAACIINTPIKVLPNRQMGRAIDVSNVIQKDAQGRPFNLAVLAVRNYEDGYQYFLEKDNAKVVDIDPQIPESITELLYVVCEVPEEECDPTHSAKTEIANFGWSKVDGIFHIAGVTVFKLVHAL